MYIIPDNYSEELDEYRELVDKVTNGKVTPLEFKISRVVRGIYEQRTPNTYMVRIRCAGGTIASKQLIDTCKTAITNNSDYIHITTRQELQLHNIDISDTADVLEALYKTNISTKGSGGNTVRNITASVDSGISGNDVFDVTPHCIALTSFLIEKSISFDLPRKLKIAFSSSGDDTALASFSDIGFIAQMQDGKRGFMVYIGGAPTSSPMVGEVLFTFVEEAKIFGISLAIVHLFNDHGNRKNRQKARLRYLFYKHGKDKIFSLFHEYYARFSELTYHINDIPHTLQACTISEDVVQGDQFEVWKKRYVVPQIQENLCTVQIPILHGNISPEKLLSIAGFAALFGDDVVRFSRRQNIHLRNIPVPYLGNVYRLLESLEIDIQKPFIVGNLVSCTGADTCQLGICFSKGGLKAIYDELNRNKLLHELTGIDINISGCPNSCGQHLVADLGFAGKVNRNGKMYPAYSVYGGAQVSENGSQLPELLGEIAAKDLPSFTNNLLVFYLLKKDSVANFRAFINENRKMIDEIIQLYQAIPSFDDNSDYYFDWGNNHLFSLDSRGRGECSVGWLDLILAAKRIIENSFSILNTQNGIEEQTVFLNELLLATAKLTSYISYKQYNSDREYYQAAKVFIDANKYNSIYSDIVDHAIEGNFPKVVSAKSLVVEFAHKVLQYYNDLEDNLQAKTDIKEIEVSELKALMDNKAEYILLDVREAWEKQAADIGGKLVSLPELLDGKIALDSLKNTIIYCRTGRRSFEAIEQLKKKFGLTNLYNLKGGIHAWSDQIDSKIQKY